IVVLDTEHRASTLYADACAFDLLPLEEPFDSLPYVEALQAIEGRYEVVIIDSASHEWAGPGGCLEHMARLTARGQETSRAVAEQQVMPKHHQFLQALTKLVKADTGGEFLGRDPTARGLRRCSSVARAVVGRGHVGRSRPLSRPPHARPPMP